MKYINSVMTLILEGIHNRTIKLTINVYLKIRRNPFSGVCGSALRATAASHAHGEQTILKQLFIDETDFIRILKLEFWENRISDRVPSFPKKA